MRAAVLDSDGVKVRDVPEPAMGVGEAIVEVAACGVCRTDLHYVHGVPTAKPKPLVLGHEVSGTVRESSSDRLKPGARVLLPPVLPCGRCRACLEGRNTLCASMDMFGNHRDGGFAERIAAPAWAAFSLPSSIPLVEGSVVSDAVSTAYHAMANRGRVRPGESVAIIGCGGVGLAAVQVAVALGANVTAVDVAEPKLRAAERFGAKATIDASKASDLGKAIRQATGGVDVAAEIIGKPATIAAAVEAVRPGGRVVVVGYSETPATINASRVMFREIEILGSLGCGLQDFPKVIDLVARGKVDAKALVTHRFPLERTAEALTLLESSAPDLIRAVVVPGGI